MVEATRGGTWAEYAVASVEEVCLKPRNLTWAEAAAVPLNGLTVYQALFERAGVPPPDFSDANEARIRRTGAGAENRRLLVTGAVGGVGIYTMQLARLAGLYVVAATSSNSRNKEFLDRLGADEVVKYADLAKDLSRYQVIIDTVGGGVLEACWSLVSEDGALISIDSASYNFVEKHRELGLSKGKDNVKALFFIVHPSRGHLEQLTTALNANLLEPFVACSLPLAEARSAYDHGSKKFTEWGKIVLIPRRG
ncbi:hypothetical protein LTR70_010380 [Exophiala xenobiotica]|uniref:Uncharacterized protein n=1 Tax=Lithohypha guttulata TaxID=1690604 RepID=A0ABR0JVR6_9EURO|nr:hypothetical protein LTR24_010331 [Lithohypha guttulata]KAK5309335.1 hypothetical protein LTR70_010380 [Exophiala xenobiotica]